MKNNPLDLPKDRLATTDEHGDRVYLYPSEVRGFFRKWRNGVYLFLLGIFLIIPWTSINGVQTILLDIPRRRFSLFGYLFAAHDAPLIFFVIAGIAFSLAAAAAIGGRVWCGWACPQTVFIDIVFRKIESWTEGTAIERRANDSKPMTASLFFRRSLKWALYSLATLVITNSFLAYFVGADRMIQMVQRPPQENILAFTVTAFLFVILLFNFGWFREQFCIIMCPYGRLQGVLMDSHSLTVLYDEKRGEPRKAKAPLASGQSFGDCVDCFRCVAVCPTGIDIRRGQQLECIGCTACIDACDEIMTKLKKPTGLIRYDFLSRSQGRPVKWVRVSTLLYASILISLATGMIYRLSVHEPVSIEMLRARGTPYQSGGGDTIVNRFSIEVSNSQSKILQVTLPSFALGSETITIATGTPIVSVPSGETRRVDFFVQFPKTELTNGHLKAKLEITTNGEDGTQTFIKELPLVGPN